MRKISNIIDFMEHPALLGRWFERPNWGAWKAYLRALFGLPMSEADLAIFRRCTGLDRPEAGGYRETTTVVGRRGGKSVIMSAVACWLASFEEYREYLSPGEKGLILCIASDRRQAKVLIGYLQAFFLECEVLRKGLYVDSTQDTIKLRNSINIEVRTSSHKRVRGFTVCGALLDEVASWDSDSEDNDEAVYNALLPAMSTIPTSKALCSSSPYTQTGLLFSNYSNFYGVEGSGHLVWHADSRTMNPSLDQKVIDRHMKRNPAEAESEWLATWRSDIESYLSRAAVMACVDQNRIDIGPSLRCTYFGFIDGASGSGADSMALAISTFDAEREIYTVVCVREWVPPFDVEHVTKEISGLLKAYNLDQCKADRYGGDWLSVAFRKHGIFVEPSALTKSQIYENAAPLFTTGRVRLPDVDKLHRQLIGLERKLSKGRASVDHRKGAHDDLANVTCGALTPAVRPEGYMRVSSIFEDQVIYDSTWSPLQAERARQRQDAEEARQVLKAQRDREARSRQIGRY